MRLRIEVEVEIEVEVKTEVEVEIEKCLLYILHLHFSVFGKDKNLLIYFYKKPYSFYDRYSLTLLITIFAAPAFLLT
jgi:hypothetical protein